MSINSNIQDVSKDQFHPLEKASFFRTRIGGAQKVVRKTIIAILGLAVVALFVFPIYWMIVTSFKSRIDTFTIPPVWFFKPTLEHYIQVITERSLLISLKNSLIVTIAATSLSIFLGLLAAYGLARYNFKGKDFLGTWILSNKMLPPIAIAVPIFSLFTALRLVDTYAGLIWIYTAFNLPLAVWLLKPYIEDIPVELERAAAVDGCSKLTILWRIVLPLAMPGILATALFCFVLTWNEYLFSLILTGPEARTLPVMAAGIRTRRREIWGQVGAAGVMITLPALLFGLAIQKQLVRGLLPGGIKR